MYMYHGTHFVIQMYFLVLVFWNKVVPLNLEGLVELILILANAILLLLVLVKLIEFDAIFGNSKFGTDGYDWFCQGFGKTNLNQDF